MIVATFRITLFTLALTLLTGIVYPLAVTAIAQGVFPEQANGSLIEAGGSVIGSSLIAQKFENPGYFHPRPSAAGAGYEANNSGASNLSVTSKALNDTLSERAAAQQILNATGEKVPADLITASGSGLDPHITPESAHYQAKRIARVRNIQENILQDLIDKHTQGRTFGLIGNPRVNVLELNLELDRMGRPQ